MSCVRCGEPLGYNLEGVGVCCAICIDAESVRDAGAEERGYQRGLAERDERVRELEALLVEVLPYIGVLRLIGRINEALAAARKETP